jgi:cysteate synthase
MNNQFTKTKYQLQSVKTGKIFDDAGWTLDAPGETEPSLVRAIYEKKQLTVGDEFVGNLSFCRLAAGWPHVKRFVGAGYIQK